MNAHREQLVADPFVFPAEDLRQARHQPRRLPVVRGRGERHGFRVEALVVADATVDDVAFGVLCVQIDPLAGNLVLLGHDAAIAVVLVELRQQQWVGEAPADRARILDVARRRDAHERSGLGDPPVAADSVGVIAHRFGVEAREVVVEHRHLAGGDDVTSILELLARRAVRLDAEDC